MLLHDTIWDYDWNAGNSDSIRLGTGITAQNLRITRDGSNLILTLESGDSLTINNWYIDNANHLEQFKTADGHTLLDSQVQNLVDAMANFEMPTLGQVDLPVDYQTSLAAVMAANWL